MRFVAVFGTVPTALFVLACLCLLHAFSRLHVCLRVVRTLCPHFPLMHDLTHVDVFGTVVTVLS